MNTLEHSLERTVLIRAVPEVVFRFFTDSQRWASWWGEGSTIEPRPAGRVYIRYPNGIEASGEVLEVSGTRIVFTYGYNSGKPIPAGSSRVTIEVSPHPVGTRVHLRHEFSDAKVRDEHIQGWRYQMSVFANAVFNEVNAHAADIVDAWFAAWNIDDHQARKAALERIALPTIEYRDRFSLIAGIDDLVANIAAVKRFMPGVHLNRTGSVRRCQEAALANWQATSSSGPAGTGTNLFLFSSSGQLETVIGFWNG